MVVLAGLQILYDWSDPIPNTRYADNHNVSHKLLSQRHVDGRARNTEAQTTHFTTHSEWVAYWQQQSHQHQSRWVQNTPAMPHRAPRSVWTLLLHGLSFSSMASAQLIKHSFNRERELLADATSVQLTRSPAILETLKAIHQDPIGSRLSSVADINGLSHFFFASSGTDLGDVSWFATHPSLTERMSAINADAYRKFAVQVVKEKRINQQKIKEIYRQRHLGDWGAVIKNSLSKNSQKKSQLPHRSLFDIDAEENRKQNAIFDNTASNSENQIDEGLEFTKEVDTIIDGRLQVEIAPIDTDNLLKPWQAKPDADLPEDTLIEASDIQKMSLPQYLLDHIYHPLGAQALIEAVMLCHQHQPLSTNALYGLADIWGEGFSIESDSTSHKQVLPHRIDAKLLAIVANLDRRLDSALIVFALAQLRRHDLSEIHIKKLKLRSDSEHSHESDQYYKKQAKCRTMLLRYQQGMVELFHQQLTSDLTKSLACDSVDQKISSDRSYSAANSFNHSLAVERQKSSILSLWQALQLQQLLPILSEVLHDTDTQALSSQTLKTGIEGVRVQLDPSGQVFEALSDAQMSVIVLLAYRLSKDAKGQMISIYERSLLSEGDESVAHYIVDLRRHARLVDIDLTTVSDVNLQWLLLTAQHLNSIQLLAIIAAVPISTIHSIKRPINTLGSTNYPERQQDGSQIDYNDDSTIRPAHHEYRQWLSTLHTVMLHDTIISQDEYDCLLAMSERWLGVRQLF